MAALRFYFHTETKLGSEPTAPTGCLTLSETTPDKTDAAAASIAGGHQSTSTGAASCQLNKPTTKDNTTVAGTTPPSAAPPATAHQFGWFSDKPYRGVFDTGTWTVRWREDDDSAGITGHEAISLYACRNRDFVDTRFLTTLDAGATDWWAGAVNTNTWTQASVPQLALKNEYLFIQVWCIETAAFAAGKTMTIHQEGSDLVDATRANILSTNFTPSNWGENFNFVRVADGMSCGEKIK